MNNKMDIIKERVPTFEDRYKMLYQYNENY